MSKNNFSTIIDYGSTCVRIGVFDKNLEQLCISSKDIDEKNNYEEHLKSINFLVKEVEKKISNHLENIIVLYDSSKIYSIDLSIKKNFDQKILVMDVSSSIILEANQLIKNNYVNDKIIHVLLSKYIIDGKERSNNLENDLRAKSIIIEIKFICLPNKIYNKIINIFKKNNLQILNFLCSSYTKSSSYINSFNYNNFVTFIDIGWERSTLTFFRNKKLNFIKNISIGGNHITKDISNVLKINIDESEKIKKVFNKSEIEFSYEQNINDKNNELITQIIGKDISIDLLKKVVLARIEEIIELAFKDIKFLNEFNESPNSILVLTGRGSHLFKKNSFHLEDKYKFKEINFYEESNLEICKAGLNFEYNSNDKDIGVVKKSNKKQGIFEKFFNLFGR